MVEEEYWCMQWSGEVLPEAAMVPDLGIFLRSASAQAQSVATRRRGHGLPSQSNEVRAVVLIQAQEKIPARLKLPFLLSPPGESRALAIEQRSALTSVDSDGR